MTVVLTVFAYLCGSVPFGKLLGRLRGIDIQKRGSGNIGFANAVRVLGWKLGLLVLAGDVGKGFLPAAIAVQQLGFRQQLIVGLAAVAGHIFPVWLKFRGGKGIATGLGVTLAFSPVLGGLGLAVYCLAFAGLRQSGPSSVLGAWSVPLFCLALDPRYAAFYCLLALVATWTHRRNIRQFIEDRAGVA